jgi:hypothetical protein
MSEQHCGPPPCAGRGRVRVRRPKTLVMPRVRVVCAGCVRHRREPALTLYAGKLSYRVGYTVGGGTVRAKRGDKL